MSRMENISVVRKEKLGRPKNREISKLERHEQVGIISIKKVFK